MKKLTRSVPVVLVVVAGLAVFFLKTKSPVTIAPKTETPEVTLIRDFYTAYFAAHASPDARPSLTFSKEFTALRELNEKTCKDLHADGVCGWGADGDVYLNAQDFEDPLTIENTKFSAAETEPGVVTTTFDVFPIQREKGGEAGTRRVSYKFITEDGHLAVDNMSYGEGLTARDAMKAEIDLLKQHENSEATEK